jgi:hypothetical protein
MVELMVESELLGYEGILNGLRNDAGLGRMDMGRWYTTVQLVWAR